MSDAPAHSRFRFLSEARWLNARRVRDYPIIFLIVYAVAIALVLAVSHNGIDQSSRPLGTDFMDVWAAGKLSLEGHPADAYDYHKHYAEQLKALPWKQGAHVPFYGWHYPPVFLLVATALATMPYLVALFVWMAATLPIYLASIRAIISGRTAMTAALAFPGVFMTLGHGQNSFLTTGLFGLGLVLLGKRPFTAGVLLGLLCYKPQFGIVLPLALVAGGHWRAIGGAAFGVIGICAASFAAFGWQTWAAFFHSLPLTQHYVLETGATGWPKFMSMFAGVRMLSGSIPLAYAAQTAQTVFCALWLVRIWHSRKVSDDMKYALLVATAMMSTPYVMDYDLTAMALPVAWMTTAALCDGFRPWEKAALAMMFLLPIMARLLGGMTGVPLGPLMMLFFYAALLTRITAQMKEPQRV